MKKRLSIKERLELVRTRLKPFEKFSNTDISNYTTEQILKRIRSEKYKEFERLKVRERNLYARCEGYAKGFNQMVKEMKEEKIQNE